MTFLRILQRIETIFLTIARETKKKKKEFILNSHPWRLNVVFLSRLGRCLYLERASDASARNKYIKKKNTLRKHTLFLLFLSIPSSLSFFLSLSYLFPLSFPTPLLENVPVYHGFAGFKTSNLSLRIEKLERKQRLASSRIGEHVISFSIIISFSGIYSSVRSSESGTVNDKLFRHFLTFFFFFFFVCYYCSCISTKFYHVSRRRGGIVHQ